MDDKKVPKWVQIEGGGPLMQTTGPIIQAILCTYVDHCGVHSNYLSIKLLKDMDYIFEEENG